MTHRKGKTWAQVAALPDGSVYVVEHQNERRHVMRMLLAQDRPRNALMILLATDRRAELGRARGLHRSTLYDIDHAVEMDPSNVELAFLLSRLTKKDPSP